MNDYEQTTLLAIAEIRAFTNAVRYVNGGASPGKASPGFLCPVCRREGPAFPSVIEHAVECEPLRRNILNGIPSI